MSSENSSTKNERASCGPIKSAENLPEILVDRVQVRVAEAAIALSVSAGNPKSSEEELAEQSLRKVFRDLGVSYRRYRKQTGTPVMPALRDAAYNFRAEPSLTTLVAVAAYLDELDLLG